MKNVLIVAIKYEEPEWIQSWDSMAQCACPIIVCDRSGVGNMAKAYNEGFKNSREFLARYDYVWFLSNVTFNDELLPGLIQAMEENNLDAIHPHFNSDHKHLRESKNGGIVEEVPFIEFTAPLIRTRLFNLFSLDEDMPYWGHDLDWSYRVKLAGAKLGVHYGLTIGHTYIRNNEAGHTVTNIRRKLRKLWDKPTQNKLIEKYGNNWREKVKYQG